MPNFEFLEEKKPHELLPDDHIIHQDRFWRVCENYSVQGYPAPSRRMFLIVDYRKKNPDAFKFLEITTEHRIAAYRLHE